MPEPITITISHRLGRDEAKRRLDEGFGQIRRQVEPFVSTLETSWQGYRLLFKVTAMRQEIDGFIDIEDDKAVVQINLPLLLRLVTGNLSRRIEQEGRLLLDKPRDA